jgi:mevalonate pyrophosphate decarboxylase
MTTDDPYGFAAHADLNAIFAQAIQNQPTTNKITTTARLGSGSWAISGMGPREWSQPTVWPWHQSALLD